MAPFSGRRRRDSLPWRRFFDQFRLVPGCSHCALTLAVGSLISGAVAVSAVPAETGPLRRLAKVFETAPPAKGPDYGAMTSLDLFRRVCGTTIPSATASDYLLPDGHRARLSLDPELQGAVQRFLEKKHAAYAVFVAVEPKTGRVLANVAYSPLVPSWGARAPFTPFPMASLFKIVTSAAAFEAGKAGPATILPFRGGHCSESPSRWGKAGRSHDAGLPLCDALAHSVNPAFGRLAADRIGRDPLLATARRFGFYASPFGEAVPAGTIPSPATDAQLMRIAAGLDRRVTISPFHAAFILAAIGNGGTMPVPSFVDTIADVDGAERYRLKPAPLVTVTTPAVAAELVTAMSRTVTSGTARKAFRGRTGDPFRDTLLVAGKTGSITGDNPRGHYHWFAGLAPAGDPKIAFAALVINGDRLAFRAPDLAREALTHYFRTDGKGSLPTR